MRDHQQRCFSRSLRRKHHRGAGGAQRPSGRSSTKSPKACAPPHPQMTRTKKARKGNGQRPRRPTRRKRLHQKHPAPLQTHRSKTSAMPCSSIERKIMVIQGSSPQHCHATDHKLDEPHRIRSLSAMQGEQRGYVYICSDIYENKRGFYIYVQTYMRIYIYVHTYMYVYAGLHTHTYIYSYIYTYTHTDARP